jgi:hypothetical protein
MGMGYEMFLKLPYCSILTDGRGRVDSQSDRSDEIQFEEPIKGQPLFLLSEYNGTVGPMMGKIIEGTYTANFEAVFTQRESPTAKSSSFILDVSGPILSVSLNPLPFSPDNDGIADELYIRLGAVDTSPIESWSFIIYDRNNIVFRSFNGKGQPPETIIWDGYSDKGELVISAEDYKYTFRSKDIYGNSREERGLIPIDILVIREGDRLKIKISSITLLLTAGSNP